MDLSVDICSAVYEVVQKKPDIAMPPGETRGAACYWDSSCCFWNWRV